MSGEESVLEVLEDGDRPAPLEQGFIPDYVSGEPVRATPEELEAVQVFARRLVEDYGYPKDHVQTRPQFRVRKRPSDDRRSFPIDIAVFRGSKKTEDELFMIVECKKKNRREGVAQLKLYLDMSPAEIGVWFNGEDHLYLRKVLRRDGSRVYEDLPNIARYGQPIDEIGLFRRADLTRPSNLKAVLRDIRNHLAGNVTGITRDEALAQEIINLLFCKIYDETNTGHEDIVTFRSGPTEDAEEVQKRIVTLFEKVKGEYSDVFEASDKIRIDAANLVYVVGELQNYCITEAERDAVGDAFEVFIGPALRGAEGQFFTPRNVVKMVVEMLDPNPGDLILDPACGSGGFLIAALEHVWRKIEAEGETKGWSPVQVDRRKRELATKYFRGIEKDAFLAKVTKAYMAIVGDGRGGVFCENSLVPPEEWDLTASRSIKLGTFDMVMTNPPFGSKIPIKGKHVLSQYELGHKWKRERGTDTIEQTATLHEDQRPQLIFLERCLQFLKPGGRLAIVLPESLLGNPSYEHVATWLMRRRIHAVVTMPEPLFKTSGKGGTHTKVCILFVENVPNEDTKASIFMADAKWCGHDSRGNPTLRKKPGGGVVLLDDVPVIAERYRQLVKNHQAIEEDHLGFRIRASDLRNRILVPKYYNPELIRDIHALATSHDLVSIRDLVDERAIAIATGIEVGKMAYGTGTVPFIRTSDISNWELKADPKHGVSEELYETLRSKAEVRPGDILMVRDGTYLIGTSAIVTEFDTRLLFQSHIYRIRVLDPSRIDPWLLFACLNAPIVKRQIRAKQFTQDIIDTLGARIRELVIPIPRSSAEREEISRATRDIVQTRAALRNEAVNVALRVEGLEGAARSPDTLEEDVL